MHLASEYDQAADKGSCTCMCLCIATHTGRRDAHRQSSTHQGRHGRRPARKNAPYFPQAIATCIVHARVNSDTYVVFSEDIYSCDKAIDKGSCTCMYAQQRTMHGATHAASTQHAWARGETIWNASSSLRIASTRSIAHSWEKRDRCSICAWVDRQHAR